MMLRPVVQPSDTGLLSCRVFSPADAAEWDAFVARSANGTVYHTRAFLSYHPVERFADYSLMFYQGEETLVGLLPASICEVMGMPTLVAHPGASYGGPVIAPGLALSTVHSMIEATIAFADQHGIPRIELLRLPPKAYHALPSDELEEALALSGFRLKRRELSCVIPLSGTASEIAGKYSATCARAIRKAERAGMEVRFSDDFDRFWEILDVTLGERHHVHPTHMPSEIKSLAHDLLPGRVHLLGAYLDNCLIAGLVVFICNWQTLYTMYISQNYRYQNYRPTNLLIARLIEWGVLHGYRNIDLGVCTAGETVNWSLLRFKESFGSRGSLRDSYVFGSDA